MTTKTEFEKKLEMELDRYGYHAERNIGFEDGARWGYAFKQAELEKELAKSRNTEIKLEKIKGWVSENMRTEALSHFNNASRTSLAASVKTTKELLEIIKR